MYGIGRGTKYVAKLVHYWRFKGVKLIISADIYSGLAFGITYRIKRHQKMAESAENLSERLIYRTAVLINWPLVPVLWVKGQQRKPEEKKMVYCGETAGFLVNGGEEPLNTIQSAHV